MARAALQGVGSAAPLQPVVPAAAGEDVRSCAALDRIVSGAPASGCLTWLDSPDNGLLTDADHPGPGDACAPFALHHVFPHGLSEAADCGSNPPFTCEQTYDVGVWYAAGLYGQYVIGYPGLDLVLVVKDFGDVAGPTRLWEAVRPALVALAPTFSGDETAFCASYALGDYAPDLC